MRTAIFHPKAREFLQSLPKDARTAIGTAIKDLQLGTVLTMPIARAMPSVGAGVTELRVRTSHSGYRAFYFLRDERGVLVFHVFEKKSRKTPKSEIELGRRRLKELQP